MTKFLIFILTFFYSLGIAQGIKDKLDKATKAFLNSPKMYAANMSFYVADENGNFIYEYQGNKGLSTASTQKIFTAATALELLGKNYKYKTKAVYDGILERNILKGNIYITSNGDPTLGSWRYDGYKPEDFLEKFYAALKNQGIKKVEGNLIIDDTYFDFQTTPGGWAWNDIGNYYGAGVWGVNWRENQFDIDIEGGASIGKPTKIKSFSYPLIQVKWFNEVTSAASNSGDKSLIYTAPYSSVASINGTLPAQKTTKISGAIPNPPVQLGAEVVNCIKSKGIEFSGEVITGRQLLLDGKSVPLVTGKPFFEYESPELSKIVYWFLRKSVNLYGETFIKTLGKEQNNDSSFSSGVSVLKNFWKSKGIHPAMINFTDGSGLSPQNYASARAEIQALLWAQKQPWFNEFYNALPIYNDMKMKSGTIKDAKGYTGYHTSKNGKKYVFSIIVNNYDGDGINNELFSILNNLK
ncbi:D-alanyl-D-alanine carboxypeptidase/D-alanyl-D-alanine-endopeptidase [Riemerella anatipestifer]|nr:D-alanyl-D-alanine carboxypeptidase/D-alanyl-D-alanine-endopeptidase [Riemerella anatipestifer]